MTMQETTYEGQSYIISNNASVYLVDDSTGKRRWRRVYDRELAYAIRCDYENRTAIAEIREMDEAESQAHWAQYGVL